MEPPRSRQLSSAMVITWRQAGVCTLSWLSITLHTNFTFIINFDLPTLHHGNQILQPNGQWIECSSERYKWPKQGADEWGGLTSSKCLYSRCRNRWTNGCHWAAKKWTQCFCEYHQVLIQRAGLIHPRFTNNRDLQTRPGRRYIWLLIRMESCADTASSPRMLEVLQ